MPKFWQRLVVALPSLAGTVVGVAYETVSGVEINFDSAAIMHEAIAHIDAATAFYARPILVASALSAVGAIGLLLPWQTRAEHTSDPGRGLWSRWSRIGVPLVAIAPFVLLIALVVVRGGYGTSRLPVHQKVPRLVFVIELSERLAPEQPREPVELEHAGVQSGQPHVLLVVDESVRGDFLDLNVRRGTTPGLAKHSAAISNFGHAVAAGNCSASSHLIIRSGAMPQNLLDDVRDSHWMVFPVAADENGDDRSIVSLTASYQGNPVCLRLLSMSPESAGPGLKLFPNGDHEPI